MKIHLLIYLFFIVPGALSAEGLIGRIQDSMIAGIRSAEVESAWLWIDVYSEKSSGVDYFSPLKVVEISGDNLNSLNVSLRGASLRSSKTSVLGLNIKYVLALKLRDGSVWGLMRNSRHSGNLYSLVALSFDVRPLVKGRFDCNAMALSEKEGAVREEVTGVMLPNLHESALGGFISDVINDYMEE